MFYLFVEWQGISSLKQEKHGPFATREIAWQWWRQQIGYPRSAKVRCEELIPDPAP